MLGDRTAAVMDKFSREAGESVYKQVTAELAHLRGGK